MMDGEEILKGKTITGMKLADDRMALLVLFDEGQIVARCDADCCSHTWIEHIELPADPFPALVMSAEQLFFESEEDGELKKYGFKIRTDKGVIDIDFRNASNGYYGGSLTWGEDDYFYGGVFKQNISKNIWKEIP